MPMQCPIRLPDLGAEHINLSVWYAREGDRVYEGDRLVEVLAGNATFDVPSPATGRLIEQHYWPEDQLQPGLILGIVEIDED